MEKIKQFFAAPTQWQRLALLSLLSMFISHLILLSSQASGSSDEIDIFSLVAGAVILLFVVGWSALNGTSSPKFVTRSIGVVCGSFEIHRLAYSFIWPKKLNEIEAPTFQIFAITLIIGLLLQSLTGKSLSDLMVGIKARLQRENKAKLTKVVPKEQEAAKEAESTLSKAKLSEALMKK
ncbi:MAG: hypothetical protein MJE63_03470 [Proteobacteria bacterium]|nr:hypothetical protein [Pseudomonadota bacterium]